MILSDFEKKGFKKEDMCDKAQSSRGKTSVTIDKIYQSRRKAELTYGKKGLWYTWDDKGIDKNDFQRG